MYLKRLDIYGFKSFGVRTRLEFVPGITAVVGPNGSGKSNIADAVRWVLGEQSPKTLRGSRMEDVIFAGSDGKKPLGYADVSLTLDNTDGCIPLEFSEITITRRVFRSGESQYLINQTRCRLRDVQELFMDTGLGKNTYALIGQGQIDQVLSARPDERRSIIEEAAGVVKYRTRKAEAKRKLEDTEQHLLRVNDIVVELERQIEPLREEAVKAKKYLEISGELQETELGVYAVQWRELDKERQEVGASIRSLASDLAAISEDNSRLESDVTKQKSLLGELEHKLEQASAAVEQHSNDLTETDHRKSLANAELQHSQERIGSLTQDIERQLQSVHRLSEQEAQVAAELEKIHGEIAAITRRKETVEQAQGEFQTQVADQEALLEQLRAQSQGLAKEVDGLSGTLIGLRERLANLSERRTELQARQRQYEQERVEAQDLVGQLSEKYSQRADSVREGKEKVGKIDSESAEHRRALEQLGQRSRALETKLNSLRSRWKVLREMEDEYEGYSRGVKVAMQASSQGRLPGLLGTVAELIDVPSHLITAMETALGGSLQNIVASTREAGRQAIEHMKRTGAGRITVLPLDGLRYSTIPKAERQKLTSVDGVIGVGSELVSFSSEFLPAVQHLLGRTIIVEDMKAAVAVSKTLRGFGRIVTLEGDQISPGGAMSGGSVSKQRTSGLLTRKQELDDLTAQADEIKSLLSQLTETAAAVEETVRELEQRRTQLLQSVQEMQIAQAADERDLAAARAQHEKLVESQRKVEEEAQTLEQQHVSLAEQLAVTERQISDGNSVNQNLSRRVAELETRLRQARQGQGQVEEEITSVRVGLAELSGKAETAQARLDELRARRMEAEQIRSDQERDMQQAQLQTQRLTQELEALGARVKELERALNSARAEHKQVRRDVEQYRHRLEALQDELSLGRATAGQLQLRLHECQRREDKLKVQLDHIAEQAWQSYEVTADELTAQVTPVEDLAAAKRRVAYLREQLRELGPVNLNAGEEFDAVAERHGFLCQQRDDLVESRRSLQKVIGEMDRVSGERFIATFQRVRETFRRIFQQLFGGGNADLVLSEPDEIQQSGLEILAQPPGKKLQNLELLSGGERALAAVAFLFAMLAERPSPFCVLDEVDAALDEANLTRFAGLLREYIDNVQFLVVTHRQGTMELADVLYGVTMGVDGISKLVSVRLAESEQPVAVVSDYVE